MKNLLIITGCAIMATSCSVFKPATTPARNVPEKKPSLEFIQNVSIRPASHRDQSGSEDNKPVSAVHVKKRENFSSEEIEKYSALQFKYAILLDASVEEMNNGPLLNFMDEWYGTRYHYGGDSKEGIDCSAFVCALMSSVYHLNTLPRMSKDQYIASMHIRRDALQEGDLVFFHTQGRRKAVSHVGVYLKNNKFIHASVSGVMISDMDEGYYAQHYVGAGRVN